jgi:hypothetical protein
LRALQDPAAMAGFDGPTWDRIVRQATAGGLLGRLAFLVREHGLVPALPISVWQQMQAALTVAEQQARAVRYESLKLSRTLADLPGPVVLLKGAAYAVAGLPPAGGRLFSDIDLLVPKAQVDAAEAALMLDGWVTSHHDAYDQRYYRQWMHELPPMVHNRRHTVLDLHHNILPETARLHPRPELILAASMPLAEFPRFRIPGLADLVLHSATHLFYEGEWQHGLRDLVDLDALLRSREVDAAFWASLLERADRMDLGRPLFYSLRYCRRMLGTPVPDEVLERCPGRPAATARAIMDPIFLAAFATVHASCQTPLSGVAAWWLYVRSHWLRMPWHLLLPHLIRKSWRRRVEKLA